MSIPTVPSDSPPEDPPIEVLQPDGQLLSILQRTGLTTIGRAEAAISKDRELRNVLGLGPKRLAWLKEAIAAHRGTASITPNPPTAGGRPTDDPERPARVKKKSRSTKELSRKWLWAIAAIVVGFLVFLIASQGLPLPVVLVLFIAISVGAACLVFRMFPDSSATASGSIEGDSPVGRYRVAARLGGAIAAGAVYFFILVGALSYLGHQSVTVYLNFTDDNGITSSTGNGGVEVTYRRPFFGQGMAPGKGNSVVIQDLPSWTSEVRINNVAVAGYVVKRSTQGEAPPWTFPIKSGEITIEMQKVPIPKDLMPSWKVVRGMLAERNIPTETVLKPSSMKKREASLTIKNHSDRDVTFVAYDCAAAARGGPGRVTGTGWADCRDEAIPQDGQCYWPTFEEFDDPTGWFALFVRYVDPASNRERQQSLGIHNLFASQRTLLVIQRDLAQSGIAFEIDTKESRIGK